MTEQDRDEAMYNQHKAWEAEQAYHASESAKADIEAQAEGEAMIMTEQELKERIWQLALQRICPITMKATTPYEINAVKGLVSFAYQVLALIKEAGYVKLDEDQSLPENLYEANDTAAYILPGAASAIFSTELTREYLIHGFNVGIDKMLKAGWRKVKG